MEQNEANGRSVLVVEDEPGIAISGQLV